MKRSKDDFRMQNAHFFLVVPCVSCLFVWLYDGALYTNVVGRVAQLQPLSLTFALAFAAPFALYVGIALGYGGFALSFGRRLARRARLGELKDGLLRDLNAAAASSLLLILVYYAEAALFFERSGLLRFVGLQARVGGFEVDQHFCASSLVRLDKLSRNFSILAFALLQLLTSLLLFVYVGYLCRVNSRFRHAVAASSVSHSANGDEVASAATSSTGVAYRNYGGHSAERLHHRGSQDDDDDDRALHTDDHHDAAARLTESSNGGGSGGGGGGDGSGNSAESTASSTDSPSNTLVYGAHQRGGGALSAAAAPRASVAEVTGAGYRTSAVARQEAGRLPMAAQSGGVARTTRAGVTFEPTAHGGLSSSEERSRASSSLYEDRETRGSSKRGTQPLVSIV